MTTTNNPPSYLLKLSLILISTTLITLLLILFHLQSNSSTQQQFLSLFTTTEPSTPTSTSALLSQLRNSITFLPLKDLRLSDSPQYWFMSSLDDINQPNAPSHLLFPSPSSDNRLLCLKPYNHRDGSKNSYALAYPNALPHNSTLLQGLTVVSDTYYDYNNIWHGLSTVVPLVGWYQRNECVKPKRWVLFHWGELRTQMAIWVKTLAGATVGDEVRIEDFEGFGGGAVCFERAVAFRHLERGLEREGRERVYDMMRCRARDYCGVKVNGDDDGGEIRVTLLLRVGGRAFKNESAVIGVFERECGKVDGCGMKVAWSNNLTFCDQVRLLSETDILVSSHGAQMTNMIFMDKNSSVMEFFPKGWLEHAGAGQYVFKWMASWSGMRHQGQWKDQEGQNCPYDNNSECLNFYKDGKIGHDEAYFATWMADVLDEVKELKRSAKQEIKESACHCPSVESVYQ